MVKIESIADARAIPEANVELFLVDYAEGPGEGHAGYHLAAFQAAVINGVRIPLARSDEPIRIEAGINNATVAYLPVFLSKLHTVWGKPKPLPDPTKLYRFFDSDFNFVGHWLSKNRWIPGAVDFLLSVDDMELMNEIFATYAHNLRIVTPDNDVWAVQSVSVTPQSFELRCVNYSKLLRERFVTAEQYCKLIDSPEG